MSLLSLVAPALIGGSFGIGGQFLDNYLNRDASESAFEKNLHWSRRAIQDRVADAERAGIHPLYALGAQTSTPQAEFIGSNVGRAIGEAGQDIAGAVGRSLDSEAQRRVKLENLLLEKQVSKTEAEKRLIVQEGLRVMGERFNNPGIPGLLRDGPQSMVEGQQDSGLFQAKPPSRATTPMGMPGIESGPVPGFQRYILPGSGNVEVLLPASDEGLGEVLENVPLWLWPTIYAVNKRHFGKAHADKLLDWLNPVK